MVQKGCNSPVVARHLQQQASNSPRGSPRAQRRPREMSVVSDLESVKSSSASSGRGSTATDAPSDVTVESGYETITDIACKGPLW